MNEEKNDNNPVMGKNSSVITQEYENYQVFVEPKTRNTQLWVCGLCTNFPNSWELVGVFSTKQKAIDACENEHYFIGPVLLNEEIKQHALRWPGAYYPKQKEK